MKFHKFAAFFLCFLVVNTVLPISGMVLVSSVFAESSGQVFSSFNGLGMKTSTMNYVADEVVIKFMAGSSDKQIAGLKKEQGTEELQVGRFSEVRLWKVPPSKTIEEWTSFFDNHPLVEYAHPNYVYSAFWVPNDPYYGYQWNFDDDHTLNPGGASSNPYGGANGGGIRLEEAWEISTGNSEVVVAVVDTGVAYEDYLIPTDELDTVLSGVTNYQKASDLVGTSFWVNDDEIADNGLDDDGNGFVDDVNGWDFVNDDAHPNDNNAHGTHVTGTVAQSSNNGLGVAGVVPNVVVMPIKVLDYKGDGSDLDVAEGIYYAANNGADIISLSLGGSDYSSTLEAAVAYAYNMGVVVIAASGNDGAGSVDYPGAYDSYVIAVGATRYDETLSYYSNYGSSLDVVAPGGDVNVDQNSDSQYDGILQQTFSGYYVETSDPYTEYKADPTDWDYYFYQGTSMATPHVSGVAALLLSMDPTLTPDQVKSILQNTAEDLGAVGRDDVYGYGLIDAKAAVFATLVPEFSCDETVKIMPLGDSITRGVPPWDNPTGYRQDLYLNLINSGFNVDFVGSLTDGAGAFPPVFDTDHEGHGGYYANEIRDDVVGWLEDNPADVVLLHIGTNDISAGDAYVADEVEEILENIDSYELAHDKVVLVILARITLRGDEKNPETIAFNDAVEAMALERVDAGDDIVIVDMESALSHPDDFADYLHPNSDGYLKMSNVWYDALDDLLPVCSGPVDLVHYWKLNETSGTSYVDSVGGADAVAFGAEVPVPVLGVVDGAQDFDGVANRVNSSSVSNPTSELTVMAWVKADSVTGTDKGIVFKEGAFLFELESSVSGSIDFTVMHSGGSTELCPSDSTPIGEWVHYAGTFNGTHMVVYKNGTLLASTVVSGTVDSSTSPYVVGYSYYPGYEERFFDGKIDEVAIFDYSLSAQEIQHLFTQSAEGNAYYTYTITASAGTGGQITPSGEVSVTQGENQLFIITADPDYQVADILVDGSSVGAVTEYEFVAVEEDHTISASFTASPVNVAPQVSAVEPSNGAVDVSVDTGLLNFTISDVNGDLMDYYLSTTSEIGSDFALGVSDGSYSLSVSGLGYSTEYTWWLNVTDGALWTNMSYSFTTEYEPSVPVENIFAGGSYNDGVFDNSQVIVWDGETLGYEGSANWHWTNNTVVNSVVLGDVDDDGVVEIITAGSYNDGTFDNAQLIVWNSETLGYEGSVNWQWINNTCVNSVAVADIDDDGVIEIVSGGYYNDGTYDNAQIIVWNGETLAYEGSANWQWTDDTVVNSVSLADVDDDGVIEIVSGGSYNDGTFDNSQVIVWSGETLAYEGSANWQWINDTCVNSVALGDLDDDGVVEIVSGGSYNDGTFDNAQIIVWNGETLAYEGSANWQWTDDTFVNSISLADINDDGVVEIVSGGSYNDGTFDNAQIIVWNGETLGYEGSANWQWIDDTCVNSVALGDVDDDGIVEIVSGGYYNDETYDNSQIIIWNGETLSYEASANWQWIDNTCVNAVKLK